MGASEVQIVDLNPRPRWLLATLLASGGRRLFAKIAVPEENGALSVQRPRLVPVSANEQRLRSEAAAFIRLDESLPPGDPDIDAISVVHWQSNPAMLVVDWVEGMALSRMLSPLSPFSSRPRTHRALVQGAGRWLHFFHSLAKGEPLAYHYPDDVLKWLASVDGFIGGPESDGRWHDVIEQLAGAIERYRSDDPEVGLHHGDMAARNLMVRHDGKIVGIDAGVAWQAPRAHDLAVFVTDLYLRSPLVPWRRRRIDDFFDSYGHPPEASWTAELFAAVAAVDRYVAWKARVAGEEGSSVRLLVEGTRLNLLARPMSERLRSL